MNRTSASYRHGRALVRRCFCGVFLVSAATACWLLAGCTEPAAGPQGQSGETSGLAATASSLPPPPPTSATGAGHSTAPTKAASKEQKVAKPSVSPPPPPPPAQQPPQEPKPIIGRTTQDVRNAPKEQAAGAKVVQPRITSREPITLAGNTYVTIIGRAAQLQIKHSLDIFRSLHGRYPKDYAEFYKEIIKANGIRLPTLPSYQKYGYDPKSHQLVILEYPDLKAAAMGR